MALKKPTAIDTSDDSFPETPIDPSADSLAANGFYAQYSSSFDTNVGFFRDVSGSLSFKDGSAGTKTLLSLVYTLPTATVSVLGGIKVGGGLAIDGAGSLYATGSANVAAPYVLNGVGDTVPFTINGISGQTAKLQSWKVNTAELAYVTAAGGATFTSKSFLIDHPTKPGKKLRHGSLEGPEHGVYVRGRLKKGATIKLPDYWAKLVDEKSITVQLTPIGSPCSLFVKSVSALKVVVGKRGKKPIDCYYLIQAARKDIAKLVEEE